MFVAVVLVWFFDKFRLFYLGLSSSERRYDVEVIDFTSTNGADWKSSIDTSALTVSLYDHVGVRGRNIVIFAGGLFRNKSTDMIVSTQNIDKCLMRISPDLFPSVRKQSKAFVFVSFG